MAQGWIKKPVGNQLEPPCEIDPNTIHAEIEGIPCRIPDNKMKSNLPKELLSLALPALLSAR